MYLDRFAAGDAPGLLVLHGYGNVLERTLAEGETVQVEPGGFLYKDAAGDHRHLHLQARHRRASPGLQAAKGLASRGFAGLKAARA